MVLGIYNALPEAKLLEMQTDVLAQLEKARSGDRFVSAGGHGRSWTKDNLNFDQLRNELLEINSSLRRLNPKKYGGSRVTTVVADFSEPCGS